MKIMYNKKKEELYNICRNVNEFIDLIDQKKEIRKWINFNNPDMLKKMGDFYDFCIKSNKCINFETFNKDLINFFGFKNGFVTSVNAFVEHGFKEEDAKKIISSFNEKRLRKSRLEKENLFNEKKEYSFGYIKYISDVEPICNLCGSKLIFKLQPNGVKKILGCSNTNCEANEKNGATNKKYMGLVPQKLYMKHINNIKNFSCLNKQYWINKGYSEEDAKKIISDRQKKNSKSVKKRIIVNKDFISKIYGEENINKFYRERSHLCTEYWIKRGYTEEIAKQKISEIQVKNRQKVKNKRNFKTIIYWIDKGYSEDEAKKIISELQKTFSKEKCIEKYGEIEGLKRWKERQDKWQTSLHKSEKLHVGFSKVSQELFKKIDKKLGKNDYTFYGSKNHEYCIRDNGVNYIYDFTDLENKKIIEFQGDIYHGNPILFEENDHPNPFKKDKTCRDLWDFDKKKAEVAIKNKFKIMHIWKKEYRENKTETINKCLNFLKE